MTTSITTLESILAHPRELSDEHAAVVRETLPVIGAHIDEITPVFYRTMFADNPELLRDTFNRGNQKLGAQQRALAASIATFATLLVDGRSPVDMLSRIGHKHASLGITPDQYQVVHDTSSARSSRSWARRSRRRSQRRGTRSTGSWPPSWWTSRRPSMTRRRSSRVTCSAPPPWWLARTSRTRWPSSPSAARTASRCPTSDPASTPRSAWSCPTAPASCASTRCPPPRATALGGSASAASTRTARPPLPARSPGGCTPTRPSAPPSRSPSRSAISSWTPPGPRRTGRTPRSCSARRGSASRPCSA